MRSLGLAIWLSIVLTVIDDIFDVANIMTFYLAYHKVLLTVTKFTTLVSLKSEISDQTKTRKIFHDCRLVVSYREHCILCHLCGFTYFFAKRRLTYKKKTVEKYQTYFSLWLMECIIDFHALLLSICLNCHLNSPENVYS